MSTMHGLRAYFASAFTIGATLGTIHGHKERKQRVQTSFSEEGLCMLRDAILGGCMYPLYIPVLPLYAFKDKLMCPFEDPFKGPLGK